MDEGKFDNTPLVLGVFFFWVILVLVLLYLYKRLNRDTNNQYTVQRFIYDQGGVRDRVIQGVELVTSLVDRIRPQNPDEEEVIGGDEGENREEDEDDEGGEAGCHNEANRDDEDEEEVKDDSSDDYSSIDLKERVMRNNGTGEKNTEGEQKEESKDEGKVGEPKQEEEVKDEERVSLLVNIKPLSGSATWSEEKTEENNVTVL